MIDESNAEYLARLGMLYHAGAITEGEFSKLLRVDSGLDPLPNTTIEAPEFDMVSLAGRYPKPQPPPNRVRDLSLHLKWWLPVFILGALVWALAIYGAVKLIGG